MTASSPQGMLGRALALALCFGAAAALFVAGAGNGAVTALVVAVGGAVVGGVAPSHGWWLGALVGLGVLVAPLLAPGEAVISLPHGALGLLVGAAAGAAGAALQRYLRAGSDEP